MRRQVAILACVLVVTGCVKKRPHGLPSAPIGLPDTPMGVPDTGGPIPGNAASPSGPTPVFVGEPLSFAVARRWVFPEESLASIKPDDRPRAYILLDPTKLGRAKTTCEAYLPLPTVDNLKDADPTAKTVATLWFSKGQAHTTRDCAKLIRDYDFDRGSVVRQLFHVSPAGTYLLAVDQEGKAFTIDMSKGSDADVRLALATWFTVAKAQYPTSNTTALKSNSILVKIREKVCTKIIAKGADARIDAAILKPSVTAVGGIAVAAGAEILCEIIA